jgi:hypothetical protein
MELIMKVCLLALSAVLLALSYAAPQSFSQDRSSANPIDQSGSGSTAQSSQTASVPAVEPADPDKVKHNGGRADVDAIGDRNVGCKTGVGNWYGAEKQIALGRQYANQVESTVKLIQDPGTRDLPAGLVERLSLPAVSCAKAIPGEMQSQTLIRVTSLASMGTLLVFTGDRTSPTKSKTRHSLTRNFGWRKVPRIHHRHVSRRGENQTSLRSTSRTDYLCWIASGALSLSSGTTRTSQETSDF